MNTTGKLILEPLPYHIAIRDLLKSEEAEIWNWYASNQVREEQAEAIRFELLKATYRLERETQPAWYEAAEHAANLLGLDVPVTIYQSQNPAGVNASLAYLPNEAHLVFHGPVASRLDDSELLALLGHELSHLLLWRGWDGDYLIVEQVLAALTNVQEAAAAHRASARLFSLYNEIFCDRGALHVAGSVTPVVSMLVKLHTGLDDVSAESYIRQAGEVFAQDHATAENMSHPEAFIRTRALQLWADGDRRVDQQVANIIEGPASLESLDLVGQRHVAERTRRLLDALLAPAWFQSESVLAHARMFFDDYQPVAPLDDEALRNLLATDDGAMRDYYCFVMLDFITVDRDLEEAPLAAALELADRCGWKQRFSELARRELRLRKGQIERVEAQKHELLATADTQSTGQPLESENDV